jgi:hypothetical protein
MEKPSSSVPFFYINPSIPTYTGIEPLKQTILTEHQKRILYYIQLLESENPIPILSHQETQSQNLYFHTNYAFYADPICTGKSFVILSLLSLHRVLERKKLLTIWSNGLGMNVFSKVENFEIPMSFLVVPHSSISQWQNLFKEETNIRYFVVDSENSIEMINTYEFEVLIISDFVFDKVCQHFQGFSVSRLIFDDLLHLEIKNIHSVYPSPHSSSGGSFASGYSTQFGDLRASFTWFICSEPYECLQKYKNSSLPFAVLIKQIFTFPYSGLIFRSETLSLEKSLSKILPELEIKSSCVYLEHIHNEASIQDLNDIFLGSQKEWTYQHLYFFVHQLYQQKIFKIDSYENLLDSLEGESKNRLMERFQTGTDPITFENINYPIYLKCCDQIYDIISIFKCYREDKRCPFCRKETSWSEWIGLKSLNCGKSILEVLEKIDKNDYNVIYIPTLDRKSKIQKSSRMKLHRVVQILSQSQKCFVYYGKGNSKKIFDEFKKQKGILIINRPIESNLHLSFVNRILVLHPKDYVLKNEKVWYSEYLENKYGKQMQHFPLTDKEFGNFVIGKSQRLNIDLLSLY